MHTGQKSNSFIDLGNILIFQSFANVFFISLRSMSPNLSLTMYEKRDEITYTLTVCQRYISAVVDKSGTNCYRLANRLATVEKTDQP